MSPTHSYTQSITSVNFSWPPGVTGLERIILTSPGDLQRVLSAFFTRPISVALVYTHTFWHPEPGHQPVKLDSTNPDIIASASLECPIIQKRQVYLQCADKTVCTATSTVRITSPLCAHLFLQEKYAIGQTFRQMGKVPQFQLLNVGFGDDESLRGVVKEVLGSKMDQPIWRKYRLSVQGFECDIMEVFPSRQMMVQGDIWIRGDQRYDRANGYFVIKTFTARLFFAIVFFTLFIFLIGFHPRLKF